MPVNKGPLYVFTLEHDSYKSLRSEGLYTDWQYAGYVPVVLPVEPHVYESDEAEYAAENGHGLYAKLAAMTVGCVLPTPDQTEKDKVWYSEDPEWTLDWTASLLLQQGGMIAGLLPNSVRRNLFVPAVTPTPESLRSEWPMHWLDADSNWHYNPYSGVNYTDDGWMQYTVLGTIKCCINGDCDPDHENAVKIYMALGMSKPKEWATFWKWYRC